MDVDEVFEFLKEILPDADPAFLERISQEYSSKQHELNYYVSNIIKDKSYPKKVARNPIEQAENKVKSTHRNSVEEFIIKYPNPHKYFSERNVGMQFFEDSRFFLMQRFTSMTVGRIKMVLKDNNGNLTEANYQLSNMIPNRQTKRSKYEISHTYSEDDNFQDEVFFIQHETAITSAISDKEAFAKLQLEEAKKRKELFECQCCFNDEVLMGDVVTCVEGHIFCRECVIKSTEVAYGDGKTKFICLCDCESEFNLETLKMIISDNLYNKIQAKIQEEEVKLADITGIAFCPFCEYAEVPPDEEKVFNCKICLKQSCRFCQNEDHLPLSCEEYLGKKTTSARSLIEDKMTEALVRECYNCKKKFIKDDGCNKMRCVCGAMMCYLCRQPVKDYTHFKDNARHRPELPSTSQAVPKCPLWTHNRVTHIDAVIRAAEEATAEVQQQNPDLHFDQKQLLKGLKRKKHEQ